MADRPILRSDLLQAVPHGFLTGPGHDGDPNPALLVPGARLVKVKQVHSARALAVDGPFAEGDLPEADGLATATPGLVLGVVTADCAPVLLADPAAGVVGAAHAGWRGAFGGVLQATVEAMASLGARRDRIGAVIGPTIGPANYEVDAGFRDRFLAADPACAAFFSAGRQGHWQFDLPGFARRALLSAGVGAVADLGLDTYAGEARFHSFRRATHRGEPTYGRQFSLIALSKTRS